MEQRLQSHYESLSRVIRFTRMADIKAGAVLALQFVLLGALAARMDTLLPLITGTPDSWEGCVALALGMVYSISLLGAVGLGIWVYIPSTPKSGKSLIYFADIANMDYAKFEIAALQLQSPDIERQLLDQIYRVSCIARDKMRRVRWAFVVSVPAFIAGIILLAWGSVL